MWNNTEPINDDDSDDSSSWDISTMSDDDERHSKLKFAVCEIYNPGIHGHVKKHKEDLYGHYLVTITFKQFPYANETSEYHVNYVIDTLERYYQRYYQQQLALQHPFIRNYKNIIIQNGFKLDIIENIYLQGGESIAILKTFWIRIIQRTWKRIYAERIAIQNKAKSLLKLRSREIGGKCLLKLERNYPKFKLGFKI